MVGKKKSKWGIKVIIFDERAGGGLQYSEDLGNRLTSTKNPGKSFYRLKNRNIHTKPSEYYNLIPWIDGKLVLPLYGVSHDEVYPLKFQNLVSRKVHVKNELDQKIYYDTEAIQKKDEEGNLLYYALSDDGKPINKHILENTGYPVIEKEIIKTEQKTEQKYDNDGNPLYYIVEKGKVTDKMTTDPTDHPVIHEVDVPLKTTEETEFPVIESETVKIVEPTPSNLRFWLARTQEEDKIKFSYKTWWEKYHDMVILITMVAAGAFILMLLVWGINSILENFTGITDSFLEVSKSLDKVAQEISHNSQIIKAT